MRPCGTAKVVPFQSDESPPTCLTPAGDISPLEHFHKRCRVKGAIVRAPLMARSYSNDLRRKLLQAHDRGEGSLSELAQRFGVSRGWAWKISAARRRTGQIEQPVFHPGRKERLDRKVLAIILHEQPDATLREIQTHLENRTGLRFCPARLWTVVRQLGFRLKKSRSTPPSGIRKPTSSVARSSSKRSARFRKKS